MTDKLDKAKWIAYQELNDDDIMEAIAGSVAIPLAIKSGDWHYAFRFIKDRIDNKMIRRTELDMDNTIKTESIDDDDEMRELRTLWLKNKLSRG